MINLFLIKTYRMDKDIEIKKLTEKEDEFCTLYVYGGSEFAGQAVKCYEEVYGEHKNSSVKCRQLLSEVHVVTRVKELMTTLQSEIETSAVKLQISETLKAVMEETSSAQYSDKFGISLSPAPLRAVSVNAAKALMELYPIKNAQEAKLKIDGNGKGIVFNVIVPERTNDEAKDQD